MEIRTKMTGMKSALEIIRALALSAADRKKVMGRTIREVLKRTRRNIREQETPDGASWQPRSRFSHKKGPMLKGLARSRIIRAWYSDSEAKLDYPNSMTSNIAAKHHYGRKDPITQVAYPRTFDTSKVPTRLNRERAVLPTGKMSCTANQAAQLIRLDYLPPRLRANLPSGIAASVRYVMQNVSQNQAHFLIKEGLKRCGSETVTRITPSRKFLGVREAEKITILNYVLDTIHEKWPRGRKRHA